MWALFALAMLSMASCAMTTRPDSPQSVLSKLSEASPTLAQFASAVQAQVRLIPTGGGTSPFLIILCFIVPIVLLIALAMVCTDDGGDSEEDLKAAQQPLMMSPGPQRQMPQGYGASPAQKQNMPSGYGASPAQKQKILPGKPILAAHSASIYPNASLQIAPDSPHISGMTMSPYASSLSPQLPQRMSISTPAASGLLTSIPVSIWSSASRSMPPPLRPGQLLAQGQNVFKIAKPSIGMLAARRVIEVLGAFDYPVAYARLGAGAEGSRLELVTEPSWGDIEVTVGPLDWPGVLGQTASLHGPNRELYGPFGRLRTGFAVGHYSQAGSVLTIMPKKLATGIAIEMSSASGQQIATVTDRGAAFQIEIGPGVDGFLIITAALATFVAEQSLIDELQTTV